jgi:hypothetical protein
MAFQVEELSLELIGALAPLMPRIKQRDKALEDQLRRAASSIGLNYAERRRFQIRETVGRGCSRLRAARGRRGMRCAKLSLGVSLSRARRSRR